MKLAIIGSRNLSVDITKYIPENVTKIISGGAKGIDASAKAYALAYGIELTEFLPEYSIYGKSAPLKRNITIIDNADLVLAFWNGKSKGTKHVIESCKKRAVPISVVLLTV